MISYLTEGKQTKPKSTVNRANAGAIRMIWWWVFQPERIIGQVLFGNIDACDKPSCNCKFLYESCIL